MFTIRYSDNPPEVELAATAMDFARLAASIAGLTGSDTSETFIGAATSDPQPYERSLSGVSISKTAGPLSVAVAGTTLSISGVAAALMLFARCLPVESGLPSGYHVHFEAAGREEWVAPESIPLVLEVADSSDG